MRSDVLAALLLLFGFFVWVLSRPEKVIMGL